MKIPKAVWPNEVYPRMSFWTKQEVVGCRVPHDEGCAERGGWHTVKKRQ